MQATDREFMFAAPRTTTHRVRRPRLLRYVVAAACTASEALADVGVRITPQNWHVTWSLDPVVVTGLFVVGALYWSGMRCLRTATASPRKFGREAFAFASGWLLLVVALVSPLDPLGGVLFAAHMTQHEVLMVAAAPLLALGRPTLVWWWSLPRPFARRLSEIVAPTLRSGLLRALQHPFAAWLAHALAIWVWHIPRLYESTLDGWLVHVFQHVCFLGTAVWFWQAVFRSPRRRAHLGVAVAYLFTTAMHTGALGALITFAGKPWYPRYTETAAAWGLTGMEDQQLGGVIMWVPSGLSYVIAALAIFAAWLRDSPEETPARPEPLPTS